MRPMRITRQLCAGATALSTLLAPVAHADPPCPPAQEQQLIADLPDAADELGISVAIDHNLAIIGARGDDDAGSSAGAAYIFRLDPELGWIQEAKLIGNDTAPGDLLGISVAIVADPDDSLGGAFAIVGAFRDDDLGSQSGSAYVFRRDTSGKTPTWNQEDKLLAPDGQSTDFFGYSAAAAAAPDGTQLAVIGAYENDHAGSGSGSAYVFRRTQLGWVAEATLHASDADAGDRFGFNVDIDADNSNAYVIVGADKENTLGSNAGAAYIFRRNAPNWIEDDRITGADTDSADRFGYDVAIALDPENGAHRAAVGAFSNEHGSDGTTGSAYVFTRDSGTSSWNEAASFNASDSAPSDFFGSVIDLARRDDTNGNPESWLLCATSIFDDDGANNAGSAWLFESPADDASQWTELGKITADNATTGGQYGTAAHLFAEAEGSRLIIGEPINAQHGTSSGAAYIILPGCPDDPPCDADIANDDGVVDVNDLLTLLSNWGTDGPGAQLADPTSLVDVADLLALLANWGPCE